MCSPTCERRPPTDARATGTAGSRRTPRRALRRRPPLPIHATHVHRAEDRGSSDHRCARTRPRVRGPARQIPPVRLRHADVRRAPHAGWARQGGAAGQATGEAQDRCRSVGVRRRPRCCCRRRARNAGRACGRSAGIPKANLRSKGSAPTPTPSTHPTCWRCCTSARCDSTVGCATSAASPDSAAGSRTRSAIAPSCRRSPRPPSSRSPTRRDWWKRFTRRSTSRWRTSGAATT